MKSKQSKTASATKRRLHGVVKMRPLAKAYVLSKLKTAYCQRIVDKYCVFTGTKINLCLSEATTRKEAWELAAAS